MSDQSTLPGVFEIKPRDFATIKAFAYDTFGLDLREGRERLVSARLGKHIRAGGFRSFEEYFRHVQSDRTGDALVTLIDALTTNHTSFMREREHFDFLANTVLPEYLNRRPMSVWSAACSSGEEPYSILFSLLEGMAGARTQDLRISATDISSRVLSAAREGIYTAERLQGVPAGWISKYFTKTGGKPEPTFQVRSEYRARITFRRFNLMHAIPSGQRHAVVFCRNVMIYFNKRTQSDLIARLSQTIEPGGYLFVGHAESLTGIDHSLKYVKPAIYRKPR